MLEVMRAQRMGITGNNPWDVDVHSNGVKLQGSWDSGSGALSVIVIDKAFYVPCGKIWEQLDPILTHVGSLAHEDLI